MSELVRRARFGGRGDRFVGLFLELSVDGRGPRRRMGMVTKRRIDNFFREPEVRIAHTQQRDTFDAELAKAASSYFATCLDDTQYGSALFGLKRLPAQDVRSKTVEEFCTTVELILDSGAGGSETLLGALRVGLTDALGDGAAAQARARLARGAHGETAVALVWPAG